MGDHDSERILGARPEGRPVSARTAVLMSLKVVGKMSFFSGREVFGGAMVVAGAVVFGSGRTLARLGALEVGSGELEVVGRERRACAREGDLANSMPVDAEVLALGL